MSDLGSLRSTGMVLAVLTVGCGRTSANDSCVRTTDEYSIPDIAQIDVVLAVHRRSLQNESFQRQYSSAMAGIGSELLSRGRSLRVGVMDVSETTGESSLGVLKTNRDDEPWTEASEPPNPMSRISLLGLRDGGAETAVHLLSFPGNEIAARFSRPRAALSFIIAPREEDIASVDTTRLAQHFAGSFGGQAQLIMISDAAGSCDPDSVVPAGLAHVASSSGGTMVDGCSKDDDWSDSIHLVVAEHLERRPRVFELSTSVLSATDTPAVTVRRRDGSLWEPAGQSFDAARNVIILAPAPDGGSTVSVSYCAGSG